MENKTQGFAGASMDKIREMVDANTVVGTPITVADGTVLIPVSKISYGFAAGGSDLPAKSSPNLFGGGGGAGINITPIAFLVIANGDVRLLQLVAKPDSKDRALDMIPDLVEKVGDLFSKDKKNKAGSDAAQTADTI